MTETDFLALAEEALAAIESAVESAGADIDSTRTGNVLTLEVADGSKIVINSQAPMQQIWVAARSGGFHFGRAGEQWRDTRDGSELFAVLSRIVSAQGGQPVILRGGK